MKKNIIFYILISIAGTVYSQNDSAKVVLIEGKVANIVSKDSLKTLKSNIGNIKTVDLNENQQPASMNQNPIQALIEKEIDQSSSSTDTPDGISKKFTISGTNVIIGNNNVIIIVDDKNKVKDFLPYIKNENVDKIKDTYTEDLFEHFAFSLRASTLGPGVEVATTISRNLKLRAGFSIFDYSHSFDINIDDDAIKEAVVGKYNPDYKVKGSFQLYNGHVLMDFHPLRNSIFHFTAGVFYGDNKIKADGRLVDPTTGNDAILDPTYLKWPALNFADYQLLIDESGKMNAEVVMGNRFKPYAGIGLGRSIPKSRFGVMFELGAMYQGDIKIKQNGLESAKAHELADSFVDSKDYTKWLKWMPMVNLQLVYRFK